VNESEERIEGKYIVIYIKGSKTDPEFGSLAFVQPDDVVCFNDEGSKFGVVEKIIGSKWSRKIKTKAVTYQGHLVTKSITLDHSRIDKILRLRPGETHRSIDSHIEEPDEDSNS